MTSSPAPIDTLYQYQIITPINNSSCQLVTEAYIEAKSPIKKLLIFLFIKKAFKKGATEAMQKLKDFITSKQNY